MRIKKMLIGVFIVVAGVFMLSVSSVSAGPLEGIPCNGDFAGDGDVDGEDVTEFLVHFGRGTYVDPCPLYSTVPKTGQNTSYATADDGDLEKGVIWPAVRFTDNGKGTITDNLANLTWLKNADCFSIRTWNNALSDCNGLADGQCGLTDESSAGEWRLPNIKELTSLIDYSQYNPALPSGHPFDNVQSYYWTSTTSASGTSYKWSINLFHGVTEGYPLATPFNLTCVKDATPPRFTDNDDGTVTDNKTGLVWLKNAFCNNLNGGTGLSWDDANTLTALMSTGVCGLTDGSSPGQWRLPTKAEWEAFVCTSYENPAVCNTEGSGQWSEGNPFSNIRLDLPYWSSTESGGSAWMMFLYSGNMNVFMKTNLLFVWPVRNP